jgi:hypothetical protein
MAKADLTAERLRELLDYDPKTGAFTSKINRAKGPNPWAIGRQITPKSDVVIVDGVSYAISRLAWLHFYGRFPATKLVPINGNAKDLRIDNLIERRSENLDATLVRALFEYNPSTGYLTRAVRTSNRIAVGSVAGSPNTDGYLCVNINGGKYFVHRVIWLHIHGAWPEGEIDHINGVRDDNRLVNLRVVDRFGNTQNTHKIKRDDGSFVGVSKNGNGWSSSLQVNKKQVHLGTFQTQEEAALAYLEAKRRLHQTCTL